MFMGPNSQTILRKFYYIFVALKLRYGLQLYASVRTKENEPKTDLMKKLQIAQNDLLRVLTNKRLTDKVRIEDMFKQYDMLSVNQVAAQIKLTEIWKATHDNEYPIKFFRLEETQNRITTRQTTRGDLHVHSKSVLALKGFIGSAPRLWNQVPFTIRNTNTLTAAKIEIKLYCQTLLI